MILGERPVAAFEMSVAPDAILVSSVRRFVGELCARTLKNQDITSRVMVAVHELLDNAVRHCSSDTCGIRLEMQQASGDFTVVVVTKNRANDDRRSQLERLLDEMRASGDSATFYQVLFERVARGTVGAGLGLGRIHEEAGFTVSSRCEDDVVFVRAEGRFPVDGR